MNGIEKVLSLIFVSGFLLSLFFYDQQLLRFIQDYFDSEAVKIIARTLSDYGRLEWSTLLPALTFFTLSYLVSNQKRCKVKSLACLTGGILAGIAVWPPKTILGRERPYGEGEGLFHFLKFNSNTESVYHSMPSGHAASTMGSAWAVCRIHPPSGIPFFIASIATGWSRVKNEKHWPSDVFMGWLIGILVAIPVVRRLKKQA